MEKKELYLYTITFTNIKIIQLTTVEEPSKYGVVLTEADGRINNFIEKPKEFITNKINAGLYLFNTSIVDRIKVYNFVKIVYNKACSNLY